MSAATRLDVGRAMAAQDERLANLYRRLARLGEVERIDAIFGDEVRALLCGSSPCLREVPSC